MKVGRRIVRVVRVDEAKSGYKVKVSLAMGKSQIQELKSKQEAPAVMRTAFVVHTESANLCLQNLTQMQRYRARLREMMSG